MNPRIWDTTLMRRIRALDMIYARVDLAQASFRALAESRGSPAACPPRCGTCCLHFVPDVTPIEADKLAFFLLTEKPGLIDHFLAHRKEAEAVDATCPFWDPDKPGRNCMIYPGRPLVCRLFGFCATLDKCGEPAFALCRQMPPLAGSDERHFIGTAAMDRVFGAVPPFMVDFSRAIVALDPSGAGTRMTIDEALMPALSRVSLIAKLAAGDSEALADTKAS